MNADPDVTGVDFVNFETFAPMATSNHWSGGNTVLTCTPTPAFPPNTSIVWSAHGVGSVSGESLAEPPPTGGIFKTGSGSGSGGGYGTNATTTFSVGKVLHYNQDSAGAPSLDPTTPYGFSGAIFLSSNRTAVSCSLTLPTGSVSSLTQVPARPEIFVLYGTDTVEASFDAKFPPGVYTFTVNAASSNQMVTVNLPTATSMPQPNAPRVTNYLAAQAVDPTKAFVLGWDAFAGGTSADYIDVDIGTNYLSAEPGLPGALNGTARTFTIPAGTLQPNSTYLSRIGFFHHSGTTNAAYAADAYRSTYTEFNLTTIGTSLLVLTNASASDDVFRFDVLCGAGQTVTVEYTEVLSPVSWTRLLTTNSPGPKFNVVSTQAVTYPHLFYRARNGP